MQRDSNQVVIGQSRPHKATPYLFKIFSEDSDFPCAAIIRNKSGFLLQTTDYSVSHLQVFNKDVVDGWMQKYFPKLYPEYSDWQINKETALDDENELLPVATICTTGNKIVARHKHISLYAELDNDGYHFTFGGNLWEEGKESPHYCEFSLRHIYIIDKALPVLFSHIGVESSLQKELEPKIEIIKNWLLQLHEKPPQATVNLEAGSLEKPKKVKSPLYSIKTGSGHSVQTLVSQEEYNAIHAKIKDGTSPNYEWETHQTSGWDWIVSKDKQVFILYYGGKQKNILGSGGFSEVRFAQELETGKWYAAKVQETEKMANEKIDIEEYLLSQLGIYYSSAQIDALGIRITFEKILPSKPFSHYARPNPKTFFEGCDEKERLKRTLTIMRSLFCSAQHLHSSGYLHRDIKMENILLNPETFEATLIDFGAVEREDTPDTLVVDCHEVHPVTTNLYNAPELVEARDLDKKRFVYNEATEMYAVGKVLGELASNYEGFDIIKYREDILGPPGKEDFHKKTDLMRYINHWLKQFMPDCPIKLNAEMFLNDKVEPIFPYSSAQNHSALRFVLEYANKYPKKTDAQSQIWQLIAKCIADKPEKRPSFTQAIEMVDRITKQLH